MDNDCLIIHTLYWCNWQIFRSTQIFLDDFLLFKRAKFIWKKHCLISVTTAQPLARFNCHYQFHSLPAHTQTRGLTEIRKQQVLSLSAYIQPIVMKSPNKNTIPLLRFPCVFPHLRGGLFHVLLCLTEP